MDETQLKYKTEDVKNQIMNLEIKKLEIQRQIESKPQISSEKLAESMVKLITDDLTFNERQFIARKLIDKVVANKEEVTIYGRIPIVEGGDIDISPSVQNLDERIEDANNEEFSQYFNERYVGLNVKDRDSRITERRKIYVI